MEKKIYDVVIVGAGPVGGNLARELAQDFDVLLLDKEMELGEPVYSTAGTWEDSFKLFSGFGKKYLLKFLKNGS